MMGTARRFTVALAATTMLASLGTGAALAKGPGGGGGHGGGHGGGDGSTLTLVLLNSQDGQAHWGQQVTFTVVTSHSYPTVEVTCYQNKNTVYISSHPMYQPNFWDDPGIFYLWSGAWSGGAADCQADLTAADGGGTLASLKFHVAA
jgi:hypothetical protein